MHKDVANSCSSQRRLDEDILRTIDHKLRRKEKIEPKKEEHSKTAVFKNWLASKTLSTYLAETLVTEFSFENDLFRVIDTIKTAVQVLSCSMRKQGFAHMFLLGINKSAKWYGKIAEDGISWNRFYINELVKTEAVCMIAYRGCPKIKRIRGYEQAPYIVVLNVPSYNTIDNCLYGCSWAIYRQPETAALMLLERDAMMEGMKAIAAGYAVFGVSTIFVLSLEKREEVMEFIYDIKTGDFLELGPLTIQGKGQNIVFNESHLEYYDENLQEWILKTKRNLNKPERQMEYHPFFTGNIIVDANRVLQNGGVYLSPRDVDCKEGRLRLMFDCIPLAIIMNKLGGISTDGEEPIIFRKPRHLGEKTAFFFGAKENVEDVLKCIKPNPGSLV